MAQGGGPRTPLELVLFVVMDRHGRERVSLGVPLNETEPGVFEGHEKRVASVARIGRLYPGEPGHGAREGDLGDEDQSGVVGAVRLGG